MKWPKCGQSPLSGGWVSSSDAVGSALLRGGEQEGKNRGQKINIKLLFKLPVLGVILRGRREEEEKGKHRAVHLGM